MFFAFLLISISISSLGQKATQVDSIQNILDNLPEDHAKVDTLLAYTELIGTRQPNQSLGYASQALSLARDLNYLEGVAQATFWKARSESWTNNTDSAIFHFNESIRLFNELGIYGRQASAYNNIGIIYKNQGLYQQALNSYENSRQLYKVSGLQKEEASTLSNIGLLYQHSGNYEKAIDYYIQSLAIRESSQDSSGMAITYGNLGNLYRDQKDLDKSVNFYEKARTIFESQNNKRMVAIVLNNLGLVYRDSENNSEALKNYQAAYDIFKEINFKNGMASALGNMARIHAQNKDYVQALRNNQEALDIFLKIGRTASVAGRYIDIGNLYMLIRQYDSAQFNLEKGLEQAIAIKNKRREMESYEELAKLNEVLGRPQNSLGYYKRFNALKDSVFNREKTQQIAEIQTKYETDKKQKDIEILTQQGVINEKTIKQKEFQNRVMLAAMLLFLAFAFYYYRIYTQKKKTNQLLFESSEEVNSKQQQIITINRNLQKSQLELNKANKELQNLNSSLENTVAARTKELQKSNEELDTFLYQSSHALRRPVVQVKGLVQIARMSPTQQELGQLFNKIESSANGMDLMLRKLSMVSEMDLTNNDRETIDFHHIIAEVTEPLKQAIQAKNIKLSLEQDFKPPYVEDPTLIKILFRNLIENAVLYQPDSANKEGIIRISVKEKSKELKLQVFDNGIGIDENALANIFNMFSVATDRTKGYGLGLYLVKKVIEKLQGSIEVDSRKNESTLFSITLPKNRP